MVHRRPKIQIEALRPPARPEAVAVLRAAFLDYPMMRFVLQGAGEEYGAHLEALLSYYCDRRFLRDWPVLGVRIDGECVAIATLNEPVYKQPPPQIDRAKRSLQETIGEAAYGRMQTLEQVSDLNEPNVPHFFVGMLAVHPEHQGYGYAATLLEHIRTLSVNDPISQSVCLATEDPQNLAFYQKHGYSVVSETDLGELSTWSLTLPTP